MKKIIVITGQTATGKTDLALNKASSLNGEIINADSRQIYKHLDIITGKDITENNFSSVDRVGDFDVGYYKIQSPDNKQSSTNLWLYDVVSPNKYFSSFDFKTLALDVIKNILSRNKVPIIVGGTYFYIQHLLYNIKTNTPPNWELRNDLDKKSVADLQNMLKKINPNEFEQLNQSDKNNPRRLVRRIEILSTSQTLITQNINQNIELANNLGLKEQVEIEYIGLHFDNKNSLHIAIKERVEKRLKLGAIEEVENILKMGYAENDPGLRTIGYQQIIKYLQGKKSKENAIEEWKIKEHQYAKRQYTFMKKDKNILWRDVNFS